MYKYVFYKEIFLMNKDEYIKKILNKEIKLFRIKEVSQKLSIDSDKIELLCNLNKITYFQLHKQSPILIPDIEFDLIKSEIEKLQKENKDIKNE